MKKTIILFLFLIILSVFKVNANEQTFPLIGIIIYLDPGHGGLDSGAINGDILEKNVNLQISQKIKIELENNGATVYITRDSDNDLSNENAIYRKKSDFDNRIKLINNSNANIYISIHQNYYESKKYYGPQVFYSKKIKENVNLAQIVQEELNTFTKTDRKEKTINNVYMYDKLTIPGILIECGFLSNYQDLNNLTNEEYQKDLAKVITNSLIKYFG